MSRPTKRAWDQAPELIDHEPEEASKSRVKREMLEIQELGDRLISLPDSRLKKISLSERLVDSIELAKKSTAHGARRRQILFVGKLLRQQGDEEIALIRAAVEAYENQDAAANAKFHALERLRTKLLDDDKALTLLLQKHPQADGQRLRTLIRNARTQNTAGKPPAAARELFQALKEIEGV